MFTSRHATIPSLVRVKPGALDRLGIYAERNHFKKVILFVSQDLRAELKLRVTNSLDVGALDILETYEVSSVGFEETMQIFGRVPDKADVIIGFGGGKALDVAKYTAFLAGLPYLAVPTSLSNDGLCSPQSSLTMGGHRKSLASTMPVGVVIDTEVCMGAPEILWHAGVGDVMAKFTAVLDWKLAFHAKGTPLDDFAALLSDASVYQFVGRPERSIEGMKLLGTTLMLNGISMAIAGSSRPASGSEHLISHALDSLSERPRLHGLQVGVATYLMSLIHGEHSELIAKVFTTTGFWKTIANDPFDVSEWLKAVEVAPSIKPDFYSILSEKNCLPDIQKAIRLDPYLQRCFR